MPLALPLGNTLLCPVQKVGSSWWESKDQSGVFIFVGERASRPVKRFMKAVCVGGTGSPQEEVPTPPLPLALLTSSSTTFHTHKDSRVLVHLSCYGDKIYSN